MGINTVGGLLRRRSVQLCLCLAVMANAAKETAAVMDTMPAAANGSGPVEVSQDAPPRSNGISSWFAPRSLTWSFANPLFAQGGRFTSAAQTVAVLHEHSARHVTEHVVAFPVDASGNPQTTNVPLQIFSYESKAGKSCRKKDQRDFIKILDSAGQWHRMSVGSRDRETQVWLAQDMTE